VSPDRLLSLLERVRAGAVSTEVALKELATLPYEDIGYARVDHHRSLRQGLPEVIFGQGKTADQIAGIAERLLAAGHNVLATRLDPEVAAELCRKLPSVEHDSVARTALVLKHPIPAVEGAPVAVVTAGTTDLPVAGEALVTLKAAGVPSECVVDVGIAGLHRVLAALPVLRRARVVIVVAGMEGALPSVVGGLVDSPVIAVPTSTGYGAALSGMTALFGMLTSCASGITVVNIDNGFGAAMAAIRIIAGTRASER
jgi:pyridinium-3,5-biscarboxylic acid mononucleotide synthase